MTFHMQQKCCCIQIKTMTLNKYVCIKNITITANCTGTFYQGLINS